MSGVEFTLTSHEVMRGIKVHGGQLMLRPSGLALFNTALDVLVLTIAAVVAAVVGGWWALIHGYRSGDVGGRDSAPAGRGGG